MIALLLGAGSETTETLLASGIAARLRNPDQADRLRQDPSLAAPAVEELLRYDGPAIQSHRRVAVEDYALSGAQVIPAGTSVIPIICAAHRDPARFADLERCDIDPRTTGNSPLRPEFTCALARDWRALKQRSAFPPSSAVSRRPRWSVTPTG